MNFEKLFETQRVLRDKIGYNEPDRFEKLILALLVEIGECANEWRGFKFWSKDQEPKTYKGIKCADCKGSGLTEHFNATGRWTAHCEKCGGWGLYKTNPLLEEYVDGLHFVLELGIEHEYDKELPYLDIEPLTFDSIVTQFSMLFTADWNNWEFGHDGYYHEAFEIYLGLGEMLGFTHEEIEAAYFEKNQVNHERQNQGY
jgi:dimeric dUTPase (all-alpha-NTP-PPase superfamily)